MVRVKDRVKSPDSPEGARVHQVRGSPPVAAPTTAPSTPTPTLAPTSQPTSPKVPFQNGSSTPPLYAQNGSTSPALSISLSDSGPPLGRPLGKIKRFLSTLVQFGQDISPETGERVKALVLNLVGTGLSVEEFHHSLQEVTNFPLRPFVLPFLRAYLPALQRELGVHARLAKQIYLPMIFVGYFVRNSLKESAAVLSLTTTTGSLRLSALVVLQVVLKMKEYRHYTISQYIRQHEHSVLDPAFSPSEPSEIFHHTETHAEKRRADRLVVFSLLENLAKYFIIPTRAPSQPSRPTQRNAGLTVLLYFLS
ncbi:hypothetical protein J6590_033007 [Homalodisca vitripennis]|nr:hypothetical protein J6590_033007 [Homalodisca vitripennis]